MSKCRVSRQYVDVSTGQLHLRRAEPVAASHTPLVCLHMSPMSSYVYRSILPTLGTDRDVIAFDTPGFGMSDPTSPMPAIGDYASVMFEGLDALDIDGPIDLIGYHTGSMTAAEMARASPARVRQIVMIAAPIFTPGELIDLKLLFAKPIGLSEDGSHLAKLWQQFREYGQGPGVSLEMVAEVFPERLLGRTRSWWGHNAAFNYEFAEVLAKLEQRILVLNPRDDLWDYTPRAAGLLRNGRILDLPDWSHGFLDAFTAPAVEILRDFFDA